MKNKKTASEISEKILIELEKTPKTITEIKEALGSNWQTIEKFLKILKEDGKVKELVSTDKKKIYQKITGDTYFNLPISEEERRKFGTLFALIKEVYSKRGIYLSKTHFAKTAVHVIENSDELSDLPKIWYLYGVIPLMVVDPTQNYSQDFKFQNKKEIETLIEVYVEDNASKKPTQLQREQHLKYQEKLYIIADNFLETSSNNWDNDKILKLVNKFYLACPSDTEFPEVFEFVDKFYMTLNKLNSLNVLDKPKKEVILTFDSLWKYIATYKAYKSLVELNRFENNKIILDFNIGNLLEVRKMQFEESFQELYQKYWDNLKEKISPKPTKEIQKIREIMQDWTGED